MFVKNLLAAMLLVCACATLRADDGDCNACKQKEAKPCDTCSTCEKVKRCGNPVKNFFVHSVGGTIGGGLNSIPGKFDGACGTCAQVVTPKSDCGCGK